MGEVGSPGTAAPACVQYDKSLCRGAITGKSCIPKRLTKALKCEKWLKNESGKTAREKETAVSQRFEKPVSLDFLLFKLRSRIPVISAFADFS